MNRHEVLYRSVLSVSNPKEIDSTTLYVMNDSGSSGTCCHPDCKQTVYPCEYCFRVVCPNLRCTSVYMKVKQTNTAEHVLCEQCKNKVTCGRMGMCRSCADQHKYDMITERLAVGGYTAPYSPFDIIVNLDYPENDVQEHGIVIKQVRGNPSIKTEKFDPKPMILCGFYDSEDEFSMNTIRRILSCIAEEEKKFMMDHRRLPVILIHCTLGVSRSSTIAIAYLSDILMITHQDAYEIIKAKRKSIQPNPGFQRLLGIKQQK